MVARATDRSVLPDLDRVDGMALAASSVGGEGDSATVPVDGFDRCGPDALSVSKQWCALSSCHSKGLGIELLCK